MNSYDIDGVIWLGKDCEGIYPGPRDVIITGRSWQEAEETVDMLNLRDIHNEIYFNSTRLLEKTRRDSGEHKANTIKWFKERLNKEIRIHFDDDPLQAAIIRERCPWVTVIELKQDLVPLSPMEKW